MAGRSRPFGSELFAVKMTFSITPTLYHSRPRRQPPNSGSRALGERPSVPCFTAVPAPLPRLPFVPGSARDGSRDAAIPTHTRALSVPFWSPHPDLPKAPVPKRPCKSHGTDESRLSVRCQDRPERRSPSQEVQSRFRLRTPGNGRRSRQTFLGRRVLRCQSQELTSIDRNDTFSFGSVCRRLRGTRVPKAGTPSPS